MDIDARVWQVDERSQMERSLGQLSDANVASSARHVQHIAEVCTTCPWSVSAVCADTCCWCAGAGPARGGGAARMQAGMCGCGTLACMLTLIPRNGPWWQGRQELAEAAKLHRAELEVERVWRWLWLWTHASL